MAKQASKRKLPTTTRPRLAGVRQLQYAPEFRIAAPVLSDRLLDALQVEGGSGRAGAEPRPDSPDSSTAPAASTERLLAIVSTGLWRLRNQMRDPTTGEVREELRRPFRHLASVWDALAEHGIDIEEYGNRPFDSGMALKVIAFQPMPGLGRETISETIKPAVYLGGRLIQMGEVIVGTPERSSPPGTPPDGGTPPDAPPAEPVA